MARSPLPIETWGKIRRTTTQAGTPAAVAYYRDTDGKRRRLLRTAATPAKAESALKVALQDRLSPADDDITASSKLRELADAYIDDLGRSKRAPATIRRYVSVVNTHVNKHVGEIRIQECTVPRLQRIVDLTAGTTSPTQTRMFGVVLTAMMELAVRYGAIRSNPARHLRLPDVESKEVKAPSPEDIAELYRLLREHDGKKADAPRELEDFADMMLATGGRIGEVLALDLAEDFNWDAWTVTVQSTLTNVPGKGLVRTKPKTASSVRTLHIPEFVRPMLMRRRTEAMVGWLFPSSTGRARWPENIRTKWRDALDGSDVAWITPHGLRKAVATALGTEAAMGQLGHSSTGVTDKHYVEKTTLRADQSAIIDRLAAARSAIKVANK